MCYHQKEDRSIKKDTKLFFYHITRPQNGQMQGIIEGKRYSKFAVILVNVIQNDTNFVNTCTFPHVLIG